MKIIIVGGGKVGESLCRDLSTEGSDIVLIEENAEILDKILSTNDIMGIKGNGAHYTILDEAGAQNCDIFVAVTPTDEINIMASMMAKKMGAQYTIARVRDIEYSSHHAFMQQSMGIDLMLNPEMEAAIEISRSIRFPSALDVDSFFHGKVLMISLRIRPGCVLDGLKLKDLNRFSSFTDNILICAVERADDIHIPNGEFELHADDIIYVTGMTKDLFGFYSEIGEDNRKIRSCMIVGASRIGFYLADRLLSRGIKTKVIEIDHEKAYALAAQYPEIEVIHGDGTNPDFLQKEHLENYDCLVSLTGIDEENILLSLLAKKYGVKKTITKVDRTALLTIIGIVGLQTVFTPKKIVADMLIKIVRAKMNASGSRLVNLYRLSNNRVEALEFAIKDHSRVIGIPLKDMRLKSDILLSYIYRHQKVIIPSGQTEIHANDRVIVMTKRQFLDDIDDILEG